VGVCVGCACLLLHLCMHALGINQIFCDAPNIQHWTVQQSNSRGKDKPFSRPWHLSINLANETGQVKPCQSFQLKRTSFETWPLHPTLVWTTAITNWLNHPVTSYQLPYRVQCSNMQIESCYSYCCYCCCYSCCCGCCWARTTKAKIFFHFIWYFFFLFCATLKSA